MAAKLILTPYDFNKNEIRNVLAHILGSDPGSPTEGQFWYNSTGKVLKFRSDVANIDLTNPVLLNSQNGAYYLARANHSGTQLASTISNFDTQVRTNRLDQMATPTADVAFGNVKITGLASGISSSDAINLGQLQSAIQGLSWKSSVRVASTATVLISNPGTAVFDGVTLVANDRILLKNQSTASQNGIYVFNGSGVAMTRAVDADTAAELENASVYVDEGAANAGTAWNQTADAITVGSTALTWVQFAGGGSYTGTAPIVVTGTAISLSYTARLVNNAGSLDLASSIVTPGTYQAVTVDTYGRVTAGADIVSGNGIVVRTAAGTYTARTITGTAARITVTNGDGVSGVPTLDIAATYVGQTSITTLGTIATGVWNGTAIPVLYGGTGSTTAAGARTALGAVGKYSALIGNASLTTITITAATHGLATSSQNIVQVFDATSGAEVEVDKNVLPASGDVVLNFSVAPGTNAYRVVILG